MAQIDASIPLQVRPTRFQTPFELQAQMGAIQQGQNQNRLAQMHFADADRANAERNQLRDMYREAAGPDGAIDQNKLYSSLASGNRGDLIPGIQKTYNDAQSSAVKLNNEKLEGDKRRGAISDDQRSKAAAHFGALLDDPNLSKDFLLADIDSQVKSGVATAEQVGPIRNKISQLPDGREAAALFVTQMRNAAMTPEQQSGAAHHAATFAETKANNLRVDARSRKNNTENGSKPPAGYRFTVDGNLQAIPGGPADLKINAEGVKKSVDANDVLSILDEVDALLPKATGSRIGSIADATVGAFGATTPGANASQQLRVLQGGLISKMPKMSGPQSDKDVLLYKQMAGELGDDTIPIERRQAAAGMIRKLNTKYAGAQTLPRPTRTGYDADKEARYQAWKAQQGQ